MDQHDPNPAAVYGANAPPKSAICDHGCANATKCTGRCQPPPFGARKRNEAPSAPSMCEPSYAVVVLTQAQSWTAVAQGALETLERRWKTTFREGVPAIGVELEKVRGKHAAIGAALAQLAGAGHE